MNGYQFVFPNDTPGVTNNEGQHDYVNMLRQMLLAERARANALWQQLLQQRLVNASLVSQVVILRQTTTPTATQSANTFTNTYPYTAAAYQGPFAHLYAAANQGTAPRPTTAANQGTANQSTAPHPVTALRSATAPRPATAVSQGTAPRSVTAANMSAALRTITTANQRAAARPVNATNTYASGRPSTATTQGAAGGPGIVLKPSGVILPSSTSYFGNDIPATAVAYLSNKRQRTE
ncbi:hypothetical protein IWW37_004083 [Coemansia sp. RSA 2050]|nr:hypothetical protein IWW37_004083 [Coemansia sp. RSA 2050]